MNIRIKKLNERATIPTRGSAHAAGMDLYACCDRTILIPPNITVMVPTGLAMAVPIGHAGLVYARSGLATKHGLRPANCVGVIDADYRGEIMVALFNDGEDTQAINKDDRIAQLVIAPVESVEFEEVTELNQTTRGTGGFGSTGKN